MFALSTSKACLAGVAVRPSQGVRAVRATPVAARAAAVAAPATLEVKKVDGSAAGEETLALKVADDSARGLVHRYMVYVRQNARQGNASTKTRSEVRGGGKKPYRQKGTGNARRGSTRSPLIVGGGVSFGPKPKDWSISMNKKERRLAMGTAIQSAVEDIIVVEDLAGKFSDKKTKSVVNFLEKVGASKDEYSIIITAEDDADLALAARNIEKVEIATTSMLNVYDIMRADNVVIDAPALEKIKAMLA